MYNHRNVFEQSVLSTFAEILFLHPEIFIQSTLNSPVISHHFLCTPNEYVSCPSLSMLTKKNSRDLDLLTGEYIIQGHMIGGSLLIVTKRGIKYLVLPCCLEYHQVF